jgi:hypothetical protein
VRRFWVALITAVLATSVTPSPAATPAGPAGSARWMRTMHAVPKGNHDGTIFALLDDGNVLVRSGGAVAAVEARSGATRWSLPAIAGATAAKTSVVLRRSNVVLAVRARDGGMLWKHPCADPPYAIGMGNRVLTMCGGRSTVLDGRDGRVLLQGTATLSTGPAAIRRGWALNDRFALVDKSFDGAWMGDSYYVVDSRSGEFVWSQTDFRILDVTATTITITPFRSMLPWGRPGTVVQRRLADGAKLDERTYRLPAGAEGNGRGNVSISRAATYVSTDGGPLFRFRRPDGSAPVRLFGVGTEVADVLGSAAFVSVGTTTGQSEILLDRPSAQGGFVTRSLGLFRGPIASGADDGRYGNVAVRLGDHVAAAAGGFVMLYDEFGRAALAAQNPCIGTRHVLASHAALFVLCEPGDQSAPTLAAYSIGV